MIQPVIESWVERVCGRYLKHFDLEVTVTGSISLSNIELRVDEFRNFVLPYSPAFVYIARVTLDLPILLSSEFLLTVKDALLICERSTELGEVDPIKAQRALQIMIGMVYLGLTNSMRPGNDEYGNVSGVELEYGFKSTDRLKIVIDNMHMRIEEVYDCHISFGQSNDEALDESIMRSNTQDQDKDGGNEVDESQEILFNVETFKKVTTLGLNFKRLVLEPPDAETIAEDATLGEHSVWSHAGDTGRYTGANNICVNKVLRIEGVSAHCSMKEYSAIPDKVAERERHVKLRQSVEEGEAADCDSDMSTDDEGEEGEAAAPDDDAKEGANEETPGSMDDDFELDVRPYNDDGTFNLSYLAYLSRSRPAQSDMLSNVCVTTKLKVNYQRLNQVFGPLRMHTQIKGLDLRINDAQMAFIMHFAVVLDTHMYSLKQKCLRNCLTCAGSGFRTLSKEGQKVEDKRRRAQLRWQLVRQSVRRDWSKYTSTLKEGALRWRAWFNEWRICARYVALRELLIFHVGFEADSRNGTQNYKLSESLLMDHVIEDKDDEGVGLIRGGKERKSGLRPYRGVGSMSEGVMRAAETLVCVKMRGTSAPDGTSDTRGEEKGGASKTTVVPAGEDEPEEDRGVTIEEMCTPGSTAALALSSRTVRALYALQLELDCILSVAHIAYCRAKADSRFRAVREKNKKIASELAASNNASGEINDTSVQFKPLSKAVLLVGVLDAVNLTAGSLGMTRLESQCHVTTHSFSPVDESTPAGKEQTLLQSNGMSTGISRAKVNESTGTAMCAWNSLFEIELSPEERAENVDVEVECTCKGIFSPVYGNVVVPMSVLLGQGQVGDSLAKMRESVSAAVKKEEALSDAEYEVYAAASTSPLFEGEVSHLHANLIASRVQAFSGSDRVRTGSSVGPSAMQTPAINGVSVRLFTKVVAGTPSAIADQKNRLQDLAKVAIDDRKAMVMRNQALAGRGGANDSDNEDEDEDDLFVLDPTTLTVQNLCASVTVAENDPLRITIFSLYVVPEALSRSAREAGLQVAPLVPVPWLRVVVGGIEAKIRASNNPWIIDTHAGVKRATVEVATPEHLAAGDGGPSLEIVFSLPTSWLALSAPQTSTTGLSLAGWNWAGGSSTLDESCFNWRLKGAIGPINIDVKKPEGDQAGNSSILWEGTRVLDHLFRVYEKKDASLWSRGIFSFKIGGESGSAPARITPEAAMRLGDHYSMFPRFRNTLLKVAVSVDPPAEHSATSSDSDLYSLHISGAKPLAPQSTNLAFSTLSRQLSFGVAIAPSRASVVANKVEASSKAADDSVDMGNEKKAPAVAPVGGSGGLFGFFSGPAVQKQTPMAWEATQAQSLEANKAAIEALHALQIKEQRDAWAEERAKMEAEIVTLRAQVQMAAKGEGEDAAGKGV